MLVSRLVAQLLVFLLSGAFHGSLDALSWSMAWLQVIIDKASRRHPYILTNELIIAGGFESR